MQGAQPNPKTCFLFISKKAGSRSNTYSIKNTRGVRQYFGCATTKFHLCQKWRKQQHHHTWTRRFGGNLPRQCIRLGVSNTPIEPNFCFQRLHRVSSKRNGHFKPHDTMTLLLHGIYPSMVTYAIPPPLHLLVAFGTHKVSTNAVAPCRGRSVMRSNATTKSPVSCRCCYYQL